MRPASILLLALLPSLCIAMEISEVMYNPPGDDNNNEFIEVISLEPLTGMTVSDGESNDTLELIAAGSSDYHLIVEEGWQQQHGNASVYSAGATIGNGLGNDAGRIIIYDANGSIAGVMEYDGSIANGNGFSLVNINMTWLESEETGGSPGLVNAQVISINVTNNATNQTTVNVSDIGNATVNESQIPDAVFNQSVNGTDVNGTPADQTTDANSTELNAPCVTNAIVALKSVYQDGEKAAFLPCGKKAWDSCEYWIEDAAGELIKGKVSTTSGTWKSWTAHADYVSAAFIIRSVAHKADCEPKAAEMLIAVANPLAETEYDDEPKDADVPDKESSIDIEELTVKDGMASMKIAIYKGDTKKSLVQLSIENSSHTLGSAKISMPVKYEKLHATIPLSFKGCGPATLAAEGLDMVDDFDMDLGPCQKAPVSSRQENLTEIRSFYTLTKIYKDNITLYATLAGSDNVLLSVESAAGTAHIAAAEGRNTIQAPAMPGSNEFILTASRDGRMLAEKTLTISLEDRSPEKSRVTIAEKDEKATNATEVNESSGLMTSAVVRDASSGTPYLAAGIGVAIILACLAGYWWWRNRQPSDGHVDREEDEA